MDKKFLLKTVQSWHIKLQPEYRGFRCANCQKYMRKAWYHWLAEGGYKTPIHFCNDCERKFRLSKIEIKNPPIKVDRIKFNPELPKKFRTRIAEIAKNWSTASAPAYKMFVCDECGAEMVKAWHVWANLKGLLVEAHFCQKCGKKFTLAEIIKGIIYDLDGTLISTSKLHRAAWLAAGRKFSVPITEEMLRNQSGISNEAAAKIMLPGDKKNLTEEFIAAKVKYVMERASQAKLFPGVLKIITRLSENNYKVWICTSAHKNFVKKIMNNFSEFKREIGANTIWREMYKNEKPSPEALNLTIKRMGLGKDQVYYIGDAFSDYKTSAGANVQFIYFCPNKKNKDHRMPKSTLTISSHGEILKFLD